VRRSRRGWKGRGRGRGLQDYTLSFSLSLSLSHSPFFLKTKEIFKYERSLLRALLLHYW